MLKPFKNFQKSNKYFLNWTLHRQMSYECRHQFVCLIQIRHLREVSESPRPFQNKWVWVFNEGVWSTYFIYIEHYTAHYLIIIIIFYYFFLLLLFLLTYDYWYSYICKKTDDTKCYSLITLKNNLHFLPSNLFRPFNNGINRFFRVNCDCLCRTYLIKKMYYLEKITVI